MAITWGPWISDTVTGVRQGINSDLSAQPIAAYDNVLLNYLAEFVACVAGGSEIVPGDLNHPFGATDGMDAGISGAATGAVGRALNGIPPSPAAPTTSSWNNGGIRCYLPPLDSYTGTPPVPVAPADSDGVIEYAPGFPALDHWELRISVSTVHADEITPAMVTGRQVVTQQPFGDPTTMADITDPDGDGVFAAMQFHFFRLLDDLGFDFDHGAGALAAASETSDATVIANSGIGTATNGVMQKTAYYDTLRAAVLAPVDPIGVLGIDDTTTVLVYEFPDPPAGLFGRRHIRIGAAPTTTIDRDGRSPIAVPDWTATTVTTNEPVTVKRISVMPWLSMDLAAVYTRSYRWQYDKPEPVFPMTAGASALGKHLAPLHTPKPGVVPDGMAEPAAPAVPVLPWRPFVSSLVDNGFYRGAYLRILRVTVTTDLRAGVLWRVFPQPADQRHDGTGMFLGADLFVNSPGDPSHFDYGHNPGDPLHPYDHYDRLTSYVFRSSDDLSIQTDSAMPVDCPPGTDLWFVCQQWPDNEETTLPFSPTVGWEPMTDLGTWWWGSTQQFPFDPATITQIDLPVAPSLWVP